MRRVFRFFCLYALPVFAVLMSLQNAQRCVAEESDQKVTVQYEFEDVVVVPASAEERVLEQWSAKRASEYLEAGAAAWTKSRKCISCHTNGSYLLLRPALTDALGKPSEEIRDFFIAKLAQHEEKRPEELKSKGITPSELAFLAGGLAEWDAHVTGQLSAETRRALTLMFKAQSDDGSYANQDCWPPFESSDYLSATVAAMAAATAPEYLKSIDEPSHAAYEQLLEYLRETEPAHDYARLMLLWTAIRVDGLLEQDEIHSMIEMVMSHQRSDGGWSIRTFAAPEAWGSGNREAKLLEEPDIDNPASDGYLTGLAIVVLLDAGVAENDLRIQKGVAWLKSNQRESGRWWTRSLNNDKFHFITYSGTCFPLLALAKTHQLPVLASE
ncbi:MAG: hypothetical protein KDA57_07915 [Planctomycetales bacterium]|nr:hypothetical protein [Planctomycetales bacterium]